MSIIGSPIETGILQAAQAQQSASKARDKEKAATESGRRYADQVDLKVADVETKEAVRELPHSDSEQAEQEQRAHDHSVARPEAKPPKHIDVQA